MNFTILPCQRIVSLFLLDLLALSNNSFSLSSGFSELYHSALSDNSFSLSSDLCELNHSALSFLRAPSYDL